MPRHDYTIPPWRGRPAPLATIHVRGTRLGLPVRESIRALLDTGADYTEIPHHFVTQLGLPRSGEPIPVMRIGEPTKFYQKHYAEIELAGRVFGIHILASEGIPVKWETENVEREPWAIVGRDILNEAVILHGPGTSYFDVITSP